MISFYSLPFSLLPLRFWRKVHVLENGCWEWTASAVGPPGFKGASYWSREEQRMVYAYRLSYEAFVEIIPSHLEIDHLCRNRLCIRPSHLEAVTHRENVRRGEAHLISARVRGSRTQCPRGHPYDAKNTLNDNRGARQCRVCSRDRLRRKYRITCGLPVNYSGDLRFSRASASRIASSKVAACDT